MSSAFFRVRKSDVQDADQLGLWRFRLQRDVDDQLVELVEEEVLPERVDKVARRVIKHRGRVTLTSTDVRWLHAALGELVAIMDAEGTP